MIHSDRYGLPISTSSALAAARYREGFDLLLSAWPGAAEAMDGAIAADPDFGLAHAARARLHAIRGEATEARTVIQTADQITLRRGSERERSQVDVISRAINATTRQALDSALAHLERWPRDLLILSMVLAPFGLLAFSGIAEHNQARVDLCERLSPHFDTDDWWFQTYRGWAHAENGNLPLGRVLTERGLELRRNNANAVHALAHAMYESGAGDEAETLIAGWLPGYERSGMLHGHLAWHAALAALERGDSEGALVIYTANVAPSASKGPPLNVVSDTASFLWRLHAYGHAVPQGLWTDAAGYASSWVGDAGLAFADVHMAMLAAATGDRAALEQRAAALTTLVDAARLPAGSVVSAICRAVLAFMEGDYGNCARILEPVAGDVVRIGGSGAQREVVEDTLLVALMRSGEASKARTLLDKRLHRRPSPRDARWLQLVAQDA